MVEVLNNFLVVKRNGRKEAFNLDKIHAILELACEGLNGVSVSDIEMKAQLLFHDAITTTEIHRSLTKAASDLISETNPNYQYVAGRLLNYDIRKSAWGGMTPPRLFDYVSKMVKDHFYTSELLEFYSEGDWDKMDGFIDHDKDLEMSYIGINEYLTKYAVRDRSLKEIIPLETPQLTYICIAAMGALDTKSIKDVRKLYNDFSQWNIGLPTPIMAGLRTPTKQFSSCVLIASDDSLNSICAASEAIVQYASKKAGIGLDASRIRAEGSSVGKSKDTKHTGVIPYLRMFESSLKSCSQGRVRGASATITLCMWHLDIESFLVLKNNRGSPDTRVRKVDYSIQINNYLYNRFIENKDITLFSPHDVPDLYEAFFANQKEFAKLYEKYEKSPTIRKKKINARELFSSLMIERKETGRVYIFNVDNVNSYGAFKVPVTQSNLCVSGDTSITVTGNETLTDYDFSNEAERFETGEYCDIKIKDLDLSKHKKIFCHDFTTGKHVFKRIKAFSKTGSNESTVDFFSKRDKKTVLTCTPTHKIYNGRTKTFELAKSYNQEIDSLTTCAWDSLGNPILHDGKYNLKSVELREGRKMDVYDITVEEVENFFANGILVHNCQEILLPTTPMATHKITSRIISDELLPETLKKLNNDSAVTYKVNFEDGAIRLTEDRDISEIALCTLANINLGNVKSLDNLEGVCKNVVRMLDNLLTYQDYMVPAAKTSTMKYRPLGIGITNLAYYLAKNNCTYSSQEGYQLVHDTMEAISYFSIKASIELAKERGACLGYEQTKWADGLLPIDRYNKHVDEIIPNKLSYDWEWLRGELKKYGVRNSTLLANMPNESNSKIFNSTSGVDPVRALITIKGNKDHTTKQVVPEISRLKKKYDLLWNMKGMEGFIKMMAVIQKFTCQSISTNTAYDPAQYENNEIPMSVMLRDILLANKYGLRTLYYFYTNSHREDNMVDETVKVPTEASVIIPEHTEDETCESCSL